jgi:hypothetical protein
MTLNHIPPDDIIQALAQADKQVEVYIPAYVNIRIFLHLLDLARDGKKIDLILPEALPESLDIKPSYFENFRSAGGRLLLLQPAPDLSKASMQYFFALLDQQGVYFQSPYASSQLEFNDNIKNYLVFRKQYNLLQRHCRIPHSSATDGQMEQPEPGPSHFITPPARTSRSPKAKGPSINIQLITDQEEVEPGKRFKVEWSVKGADRISFNHGIGAVPKKGIRIVSIHETTELVLTAENAQERQSKAVTIRVSEKPRIHYRLTTTDPSSQEEIPLYSREDLPNHYAIIQGQSVRIYWNTFNTLQLRMEEYGSVPLSGNRIIVPDKLTAITFIAEGEHETVDQTAIINVFPVPTISKLYQTETPHVEISTTVNLMEPPAPEWVEPPENIKALLNELTEKEKAIYTAMERNAALEANKKGWIRYIQRLFNRHSKPKT